MSQNAIPPPTDDTVASTIAHRTLSPRGDEYKDEVRRILDAALKLMSELGTDATPRVADIVAAAGVSNDAFYRYFASKDALVTALLEDGAVRLASYLEHQMAKESTPERKIRRWIDGVLSQAEGVTAKRTLAVLWNGGVADGAAGRNLAAAPGAQLLEAPLAELGSTTPGLDAVLIAHAVVGRLADHLWQRTRPTAEERREILRFCLQVAGR